MHAVRHHQLEAIHMHAVRIHHPGAIHMHATYCLHQSDAALPGPIHMHAGLHQLALIYMHAVMHRRLHPSIMHAGRHHLTQCFRALLITAVGLSAEATVHNSPHHQLVP